MGNFTQNRLLYVLKKKKVHYPLFINEFLVKNLFMEKYQIRNKFS